MLFMIVVMFSFDNIS